MLNRRCPAICSQSLHTVLTALHHTCRLPKLGGQIMPRLPNADAAVQMCLLRAFAAPSSPSIARW